VQGLEFSTQRKYRNTVEQLRAYFEGAKIADISEVTLEQLDAFRASRKLGPVTASKELQVLRQFFGFCVNRKWTGENIAKQAETPRNVRPAEVIPYTTAEVSRIVAACDVIGRTSYERLRARAMVLLLSNTALRVSDVALLARDRVRDGRVILRTLKTGDIVSLPIWRETQTALDALPLPRGTEDGGPFFFWNGTMSKRAAVGIAERTLAAVFKASGVAKAHAHRFRHTLATRLLGSGASEQEVADILGNSPAIVRKHYAKWSKGRQDRIDSLMANSPENFGTSLVHEKKASLIN
jgi:site-specific recombinase XerD